MTCAEAEEMLAALSLAALEEDERQALERHVAGCPKCTLELRRFQETTARLASALPQQEPPPELKRRLLEAAGSNVRAGGRRWSWPWSALPRPQSAAIVAAFSLVVALSTTIWAAGLQMQLNEQRETVVALRERSNRYDRVVAVLQATDLQIKPMQGTDLAPSAVGRVYVDPQTGAGMMMVRYLPTLPPGRAYQLWWVRPDGKRESGGLLTWTDPNGNGYTLIQCPTPCSGFQAIGITEEPRAGSPAPTGQRLLGSTL